MGEFVEPRPGAYVLEWEAIQVCGAECFPLVRRLLKGSPWVAQLSLTDNGAEVVCSQVTPMGIDQWHVKAGEWVVKSPHGRFWFMSESEFESQFTMGHPAVCTEDHCPVCETGLYAPMVSK